MPDATPERCLWKMPKSATSSASWRLVQDLGWQPWAKGHLPAWRMFDPGPAGACTARVGVAPWEIPFHFGPVRSPWAWYASLWQHTLRRKQFRPSRDAYATGPGFRGFLHGVTHIDPERIADINKNRLIVILDPEPGCSPPDGSAGLWTWCVDYFYRKDGEWLLDVLYPVDRAQEAWCEVTGDNKALPLRNTAKGRLDPLDPVTDSRGECTTDYSSWYDDEMVRWVSGADAEMINVFDFSPFTTSPQAIYPLHARRASQWAHPTSPPQSSSTSPSPS